MTSPNKAKGNRWELAVVRFLAEVHGRDARRPHAEGALDVSDVHLSPFALQAKDVARHDLAGWVEDAERQAAHAGERWGAAVIKRRGKGPAAGYVVMSLATFRDVAAHLKGCDNLTAGDGQKP